MEASRVQEETRTLRLQKGIGIGVLATAALFVAAAAAGLVFPFSQGPERTVVRFEVGTRLAAEDDARIAAIADRLLDAPTSVAVVTGHTGPDGDPEANLTLSRDRAAAVRDGLIAAGIPAGRIRIRGAGGAMPPTLAPDATEAERAAASKRAEIRLVERRLLAAGEGA